MKVVLSSPFTPPLIGGLENVCLWLAKRLQADGHDVSIVGLFAASRPGLRRRFLRREPQRRFECDGIPVSILPPLPLRMLSGLAIYSLMQSPTTLPIACRLQATCLGEAVAAHCRNADVVHYLGTGLDMLGFVLETTARAAGAAFTVEPAIHIGQWGDRWIDGVLYQRADAVIAYSDSEAEAIQRLGTPSERVHRIHCGITCHDGGNAAAFRARHAIHGPLVLFLGRKTEAKGVRRLLDAWPAIRREFPQATVVFMGPSDGRCEIPSNGSIIDIDDADESEKADAIAACDLLCVPSDGESFGLVYFEAWARAKPVVAIDQPALRETIGQSGGGLLVQPRPHDVAAAVVQLLSDTAMRSEMGRLGREFARRHHAHDTYREYLDAFAAASR